MKSSLTSVRNKKNSPVKNIIMLFFALLIGMASYYIYVSNTQRSLLGPNEGSGNTPLSLKNIDWNTTFFSTESYKELKIQDLDLDTIGQLGNKNPFERLKKEDSQ